MKIVKPKSYSTEKVYKFYKKKYPNKKIPYWFFKEVISRCNKKVSLFIIQGYTLKLSNTLGFLKIRKIERNFSKFVPNWKASKELKEKIIKEGKVPKSKENPDGENYMVYFTDKWYFRWGWIKKGGSCSIKNQKAYQFYPTSNNSRKKEEMNDVSKMGNKGRLTYENKKNPLLHLRYE